MLNDMKKQKHTNETKEQQLERLTKHFNHFLTEGTVFKNEEAFNEHYDLIPYLKPTNKWEEIIEKPDGSITKENESLSYLLDDNQWTEHELELGSEVDPIEKQIIKLSVECLCLIEEDSDDLTLAEKNHQLEQELAKIDLEDEKNNYKSALKNSIKHLPGLSEN
tara:strand:- start:329 stop:820 length:492 start_codon:yes stop_codon:yes gene_type:complete